MKRSLKQEEKNVDVDTGGRMFVEKVEFLDLHTSSAGVTILYKMEESRIELVFTVRKGGDCAIYIDKGTTIDLLNLMKKAIQIAESGVEQWEMVGFVEFPSCDRIDYLEDSSGHLILQACGGRVSLTFRFNPQSGEVDWPVIMLQDSMKELAGVLEEV